MVGLLHDCVYGGKQDLEKEGKEVFEGEGMQVAR